MKKTTKGAVAAGAAVLLLLGSGGTLAYWNDTANVGANSTIQSGNLALVAGPADPTWTITHTSGAVTPVTDINSVRIVPGDVLTYTVPATITAQGDNLTFNVALAGGAIEPTNSADAEDVELEGRLTESATFAVAGASPHPSLPNTFNHDNSASSTYATTITATITWPFDEGADSPSLDNPAKLGSVDLSQFALTVTQVDGSI